MLFDLAAVGSQQDIENSQRMAGLQSASNDEQRRNRSLRDMSSLASNLRNENQHTEQANVDIMNAFNSRMTMGKNQYNQQVADVQNRAALQNRADKQNINNQNIGVRNDASQRYIDQQRKAYLDVINAKNQRLAGSTGLQTAAIDTQTAGQRQGVRDITAGVGAVAGAAGSYANMENSKTKNP